MGFRAREGWRVLVLCGAAAGFAGGTPDRPGPVDAAAKPPHRVFPTSRFAMDEILSRPYTPDVPMGCVGARLWASSPQGWAFRDDTHWLYLTNLRAFEIELRDGQGALQPACATYYPSHVHMSGAVRAVVASASFTFPLDNAQNPLAQPFRPEKRWTCWSSGRREDWYAVDLGARRPLTGLRVFFFDDAPSGGCRPPEHLDVERWTGDAWEPIAAARRTPERPAKGENVLAFEAVETDRVRLVFRNAGDDFYTGLYGFEALSTAGNRPNQPVAAAGLEIEADKFITADDALVSLVEFRNTGQEPLELEARLAVPLLFSADRSAELAPSAGPAGRSWRAAGSGRLHDTAVAYRFGYSGTQSEQFLAQGGDGPSLAWKLAPGQAGRLRVALAIDADADAAERALAGWLDRASPLDTQRAEYQAWFDANLAYFDCSDPWVRKMYYHRAYNLRKNTLDPQLGRMRWKAFSEGRWRSNWYPNVISYGAAHQIREARWLRDPSYWQGHLRTFAENEKPDGVYPSHVRPSGPQGGQYTDWITSAAWDGYLVHRDKPFLAVVADKLAANVRGWQKVYDPDGDGLLLVDDHWWTGMEWQPSFFAFSGYKTDPKDRMHPASRDRLERVDLTAYNYGNAVAVANIYDAIGQPEKAREFRELADRIAGAVRAKMWDDADKFFYSLRYEDKRRADVKEIIGVYPFYFGMLPAGQGYEAAWSSIVDPDEFWTAWPVASASQKCPAYSQNGWPTDRGGSGCMWNGPTWPHANSIVLTAMARTLRQARAAAGRAAAPPDLPIDREHLWQLFYSFTRAQYREQDLAAPWTGEFYNGDNGKWQTAERDYNHSTWIDILLGDLVGLVPRGDDTLEIDPLLPHGMLSYFLVDGQHYHGHDVTIAWDAADGPDHFDDGRKGLDVYVDGARVASSERLERLEVRLTPRGE